MNEFKVITVLVGVYIGIAVLTLGAIALMRDDPALVTDGVWIRGSVVVVSSLFTLLFARQAERGSRKGLLRLRIVSTAMLVAMAVIAALPGAFPVWMRVDQAVCGVVLLGVVVLANRKRSVAR